MESCPRTRRVDPSGVTASSTGGALVGRLMLGFSVRVGPGPMVTGEIEPEDVEAPFTTYAVEPSGLMAMPTGLSPTGAVATMAFVAVLMAFRVPPAASWAGNRRKAA